MSTLLIHAGEPEPRIEGAVSMPVFQTANFINGGEASYQDVRYARLNNTPNHVALAGKLAAIEGGEAALALGSGMAAIASVFFALLKSGDHVLVQKTLYGGTYSILNEDLRRFGVTFDYYDAERPEGWKARLKPSTKLIYAETISNPLMEVPELEEIAKFARANGLISVIDNTFASPVNFRPLGLGFDLSLHSATKYLNGHSDVIAGAVIGRKDLIAQINHSAAHLGGTLDTHACFLLHRGMKTLAVRMERHNASALKIAGHLSAHPAVARVNFPGLETSPSFARARKYLQGFGGMLSFELKNADAEEFMRKLKYPLTAASLGGVESLVIQPAKSSHLGLGAEERARVGISESLIRYSVGLEDPADLIADIEQALG
jgi:cystathionine beta-lyase/cystathionine gamma-synthase